jgi:VanZ family protein
MAFIKNTSLRHWISAYLPPLGWAAVIFLFSAQTKIPGPDVIAVDFVIKKAAHVFVYAMLYVLLYRAGRMTLSTTNAARETRFWLVPFLICFAYAASDEFHQSLVIGRTSTLRDVGYDMLGALISFLAIHRYL